MVTKHSTHLGPAGVTKQPQKILGHVFQQVCFKPKKSEANASKSFSSFKSKWAPAASACGCSASWWRPWARPGRLRSDLSRESGERAFAKMVVQAKRRRTKGLGVWLKLVFVFADWLKSSDVYFWVWLIFWLFWGGRKMVLLQKCDENGHKIGATILLKFLRFRGRRCFITVYLQEERVHLKYGINWCFIMFISVSSCGCFRPFALCLCWIAKCLGCGLKDAQLCGIMKLQ